MLLNFPNTFHVLVVIAFGMIKPKESEIDCVSVTVTHGKKEGYGCVLGTFFPWTVHGESKHQ